MSIRPSAFLLLALLFSACGVKDEGVDWKKETHSYEAQGWKYLKTFGHEGDAVAVANMDAKTAYSVSGFWTEHGVVHKEEFSQADQLICLLVFTKPDNDTFLVVLTKPKPGPLAVY
jgi:hypothetical protein